VHGRYWLVTGHSYIVYGPLSAGATTVMYEGAPDFPQPDRFWRLIEKYRVNIFYTSPTGHPSFVRQGDQWPNQHDMSSLRLLGSVGEPIKPGGLGVGTTRPSGRSAARLWTRGGRPRPAPS